jgi:drug/metabolite transporter (DMT)-like permease
MSMVAAVAAPEPRLSDYGPGIGAALSFSAADVLSKVIFGSGLDVLSLVTLRGLLSVALFWTWLRVGPPAVPHTSRARLISIGLGLLYAITIFGLLYSIQVLPLSIAILTYFVYPLLTGIAAAILGIERLDWRSFATALVAFAGLALMLNAQPGVLSVLGLLAAFGGAVSRVISLLVTRAALAGTDARLTTWYSLLPAALVFVFATGARGSLQLPGNLGIWLAISAMGVSMVLSTLGVYVSTARVGAFRTALSMNLEPVVTSLFSFVVLGEAVTGMQLLGGGVMVGALCVYSLSRGSRRG